MKMMFVLYDDFGEFIDKSKKIVHKVSSTVTENEVKGFTKYDSEFEKIIEDQSIKKIYVLDIEVKDSISGIEVAKKIRKTDWDSIIIMVTSHTELGYEALKAQIMLLDFISKHNDWEEDLYQALDKAISLLSNQKVIVLDSHGITYRIHTSDIVYIVKDSKERKCTIKTINDEIPVFQNITDLGKKLDKRFFLSHRSCYINLDQISNIDWKNGEIYFRTGDSIDYLARDRKKELKEYVRSM